MWLGSRPSLGYPGDKYEMGLEAIEEIEVVASSLVAEIFCSQFAENRVPSGAMANLSFMSICNLEIQLLYHLPLLVAM